MKYLRVLLVGVFLQSSLCSSSEAIGYYSSGTLKDSESVMDKGMFIHKLFLARKRFFGTVEMNDIISDAVDFLRHKFPGVEQMQIGDIANKNGGACNEHASHQNGLDADIVYLTKNGKLQSPDAAYWEEDFVKNKKVSSNFNTERNFLLFKYLINTKPVARIFVDEAVKKLLCTHAKDNDLMDDPETIETLRRLRVEKLHSTHFHMRLKCSDKDYSCESQGEVPPGSGC